MLSMQFNIKLRDIRIPLVSRTLAYGVYEAMNMG
jgi:hypothetical protein